MPALGSLIIPVDPEAQPNPARWKTFNHGCSISCGFKFRSTRARLESPPLAALHMKEIWRFQPTPSLIWSNSATVAKNAQLLGGCLKRHMVTRSSEVMLQDLLAWAGDVWRSMFNPAHHHIWGEKRVTVGGVQLKILRWINPESRHARCLPSHILFLSPRGANAHQPPL